MEDGAIPEIDGYLHACIYWGQIIAWLVINHVKTWRTDYISSGTMNICGCQLIMSPIADSFRNAFRKFLTG